MTDSTPFSGAGPEAEMGKLFRSHSRSWSDFQYVYPVISRRSQGLSVGINLNLDRVCNFNCVYCQVDRKDPARAASVDLGVLQAELGRILDMVLAPTFWDEGPFAGANADYRRLDNIAFSGDGEPTLCRWFTQAVALAAVAKSQRGLDDVKLVLITNASQLQLPSVEPALRLLDRYQGEVWAKLDAGSEKAYRGINRSRVPFEVILDNLVTAGQKRPLVIQTMVLHVEGQPVATAAFDDYLDCLDLLRRRGCRISRVQLYTIARAPAETWVAPLSDVELDALAARFRARQPELPVRVYYAV
ncbi:MAG: radical SAM protein [Lentisphaerae bacterium]|nr:radical SAM protein [Lentisphaerota bacterium]